MNYLLAGVSSEDLERLAPHLVQRDAKRGDILFDAGDTAKHAWFPHSGVLSLVSVMREGGMVETRTVGREGAVGLLATYGDWTMSNRCIVQVPGTIARIGLVPLRTAVAKSEALRDLVRCYSQAIVGQLMQAVACNALHPVEARLCRWLLTNRDRCDSDMLPLTHEFLADMLGVQRATVSLIARTLQSAGLIRTHRGQIEIRDRQGLEDCSCECYSIIRQHYERVMPAGFGPRRSCSHGKTLRL